MGFNARVLPMGYLSKMWWCLSGKDDWRWERERKGWIVLASAFLALTILIIICVVKSATNAIINIIIVIIVIIIIIIIIIIISMLARKTLWCPPAAFLARPPPQPWLLCQPSVTPAPLHPLNPPPLFSGRCQDFLGSDCQIGGPNVTTATTTSHIQPRESHVTIHMGRKVTMRQCFVLCVKYRA